jgi:mono/diheme cytochrome c family protein
MVWRSKCQVKCRTSRSGRALAYKARQNEKRNETSLAGFFLRREDTTQGDLTARGASRNIAIRFVESTTKDKIMKRRAWSLHACALAVSLSSSSCSVAPARAQSEVIEADMGEKIFTQNNCFVCHGQQGFGGIGPAFRNDPFLLLTEYVACQILLGRGVMPPFGNKLDDNQIAAVASYVRNSWGNHFGAVKPEEVAQVRQMVDAFKRQIANPSSPRTGSTR